MDYEGTRDTAPEVPMGDIALGQPSTNLTAAAAASASVGGTPLIPDANNTVVLPEGATLDDITVRGRDLVIQLDDGRIFIIPDGAVFVPQIVAQGVTVPPLNLAALLVGQEPEPAAGPVRSSGGNFAVPVDPLQDAYDLGDLLPYTELKFPDPRQREIFPEADREPETTPNPAVQLDDDALEGGNAGGTGDDPDNANTSGTLTGSGGDGALTWALATTGAPAGFSYVANGTGLDIFQGETLVLRVTLNTATGAYTVTQVNPIDHATGNNENNQLFTLTYSVTDEDGDSAGGTLDINVDDDSPATTNRTTSGTVDEDGLDGGIAGGEGDVDGTATTATGSVAGLFAAGADGGLVYSLSTSTSGLPALTSGGIAVTYAVAGNVLTASAGANNTVFTLTLNPATAQWTFELVRPLDHAAGNNENDLVLQLGSMIVATDADGDSVTGSPASLTVTVDDDSPLVSLNETEVSFLTVDETNLGTNATADYSGFFTAQFGADGAAASGSLTYALGINPGATGLIDTASGLAVVLSVESGQVVGRAGAGGAVVFTVSVDGSGNVTLDQQRAVVHGDTENPNDAEFFDASNLITLSATATDRDGDTASQTINIAGLMRMLDDGPTATNDTDTVKEDGPSVADGNVFTGSGGSDANNTDGNADSIGADGAPAPGAVTGITGGTVGSPLAGTYGSVTINASGAYVYTLDNTNAEVQALGEGETRTDVFTYTITDRDGDTATAKLTITIQGTNDAPVVRPATTAISEEGLAGGNPDTAGNADTTNSTTVGGTIAASDVDGDTLSYTLGTPSTELTSNGDSITWSGAGTGTLIGSADGTEVIRVTIDSSGNYTVTLSGQIDHPVTGSEDDLDLDVPVNVSDGTATIQTTLTVSIEDDSPVVSQRSTSGTVDEDGLAGGNTDPATDDVPGAATTASGSVSGLFSAGADTALSYNLSAATATLTAQGLTSGGVALSYTVNGNLLTASAGANTVFTLALDSSTGAWTFSLLGKLDHAIGADENDITIQLGAMIVATDRDGDSVTADAAGLTVVIDDDTPVLAPDTDEILSGSNAPATGNVLTDNDPGDADDTDTGADHIGADGGASTGTVIAVLGNNPGGTSDNTPDASGNLVVQGQYGTLTLNVDGTYSYVRAAGTPGNVEDVFTYTIKDGDGDTASTTLTISIEDARPVTTPNDTVPLDDDAQPNGNPDGIGDDPGGKSASGTLTGSGGDGALTWAFQLPADDGGFSYVANGTGIDVFQGTTKVLAVTLNSGTGAYTVTQLAPIQHATGDNENNQPFTLNYTVTDSDGDSAPGTLAINVDDDSPLAANDTDSVKEDGPLTATGNVLSGAGSDGNAAGADSVGADGPAAGGAVTAIAGGTIGSPLAGSYGSITLGVTGGYTYTLNNANAAVQALDDGETLTELFTYTITDRDGDTTTATLTITIQGTNDAPVVSPSTTSVSEEGLGGANVDATGTPDTTNSAVAGGTIVATDVDGETLTYTLGNPGAVLTSNGSPVTWAGVGTGTLIGSVGGTEVIRVTINASGVYTVTLSDNVDHAGLNVEDLKTFTVPVNVSDGTATTGTIITVNIEDDSPIALAGAIGGTVDEDGLPGGIAGGLSGDVAGEAITASGSVTSLFSAGADSPATYSLSANTSGLPALTSGGATVSYAVAGNVLTASAGGNTVFTLTLNTTTGQWDFALVRPLDHPAADGENDIAINFGGLIIATDRDGDSVTATGSLTVTIDDDSPTVSAPGTQPTLVVDETLLGTDASASFAAVFTSAFGADGPASAGSTVYALGINAGATGLFDVATGNQVVLTVESGQVVGRAGAAGPIVFTVSVAANGTVTLDQQRAVLHNDPLDHDEPGASAATLAADSLITLTATVTDRDGDQASATANIGQNLQFEDDGPSITSVTTPLTILNSGSVAGTGSFVFTTGNDGAAGTNDAIQSVTFAGTVNGVAVTSPNIVAGPEDATTANFTFSFTYATGAGTTATANGTLVFNKTLGTYTVDLDGPIQSFSVSGTASGTAFLGYELNSSAPDGSQPAVSVTQISPNLFLQFTSVAEPSSGTGANNLGTVNYGLDTTPPSDGANLSFSNGELFNQAAGWVSISNTANGVNGDTIGGGEVLDFNLYNSNPQGFVGTVPTASTSTMYLKFDGIGTGEDFIMLLKLWNPTTGEYTTRAIMVQNSDIQKGPGSGPGVFSGITLDNNDGLIVIEANDYNLAGENFVIVGAQIAGSDEGIAGSAYNFNNATGAGGGSTTAPLQAFSTDIGDGPMKISDIGFVTVTSTAQPAQLTFGVTVQDRDGDTDTETLVVNIGAAPAPAEPLSAKSGATTSSLAEAEKLDTRSAELLAASTAATGLLAAMALEQIDPAGAELASTSPNLEVSTQQALPDLASDQGEAIGADTGSLDHRFSNQAVVDAGHSASGDEAAALGDTLDKAGDRFAGEHFELGGDAGRSELFDYAENAMNALLAKGAFPAAGGMAQVSDPAIAAALTDSADAQVVDSIVDHFAGPAEATPELLGQGGDVGFENLLQLGVSGGGADFAGMGFGMMQTIDHEEANAMA